LTPHPKPIHSARIDLTRGFLGFLWPDAFSF